MGSRAQEEGLEFEISSIVTKRKEGVTKGAGLGGWRVGGFCGGKMRRFLCSIFSFPREV